MSSLALVNNDNEKVAHDFLTVLKTSVPRFLDAIVAGLHTEWTIDVDGLVADHVCWRTATLQEYKDLVDALSADRDHFKRLIESEIGGRAIATFQLVLPISSLTTQHQVNVIEIPSPKEGRPYAQGLEHVEFIIGDSTCTSPFNDQHHQQAFENFRQKYPGVIWNEKATKKKINPDLSVMLQLPDFGACSAKFHLMPLADVIIAELKARV